MVIGCKPLPRINRTFSEHSNVSESKPLAIPINTADAEAEKGSSAHSFGWLSALLSLWIPGAAHIVNGHLVRGLFVTLAMLFTAVGLVQLGPFLPVGKAWLAGLLVCAAFTRLLIAFDAGRLPSKKMPLRNTLLLVGLVVALQVGARLGMEIFFQQGYAVSHSFWIPSESAIPTLQVGDYIIADTRPLSAERPLRRCDTVVFKPPGKNDTARVISRVIALGGDSVEVKNGELLLNGTPQVEPYINEPIEGDFQLHKVREGRFFVLGDNRNNSHDSRYLGDIPMENYRGRVAEIFWSQDWSRVGTNRLLSYPAL